MHDKIDGMAYFYHPEGQLIRITRVTTFNEVLEIFHQTTCKHFIVCDMNSHNVLFIGYIHSEMKDEYELVTLITHNNEMNRKKL